jgi:hypothetical protein
MRLQGQCISFDYQIDHHYSEVYASLVQELGQDNATAHLGRSIFAVAIGGNDIINYVRPSLANQLTSYPPQAPDKFIASLALSLKGQLQVKELLDSALLSYCKLYLPACNYSCVCNIYYPFSQITVYICLWQSLLLGRSINN